MIKNEIDNVLIGIEQSNQKLQFQRLLKICEKYFGNYRVKGSHHIFKTPWQGDPRINLQKGKDKNAKPYQVRQVLDALRKLQKLEEDKQNEQNDKK
jgi:predicted RNA binding protein YcfA (HicA-like mRNA interferase family)